MTMEEFEKDLEDYLIILFAIERINMPRSSFAGVRNPNAKVKRTNNLRNLGFQYAKTGEGKYQFSVDLARFPYGGYIDEVGYITHGYWKKICKDILERLAARYNGTIT